MTNLQQGIGLLGGSFDPVHNGHIAIVRSFLESEYISELWLLLTPESPHKTEEPLTDYECRMQMLQAAFQSMDRVKISDIERELPRPSYTIRTLRYLSEEYPDEHFFLCLGEDSLREFTQWKDWKKILDYCELLVARRPIDGELSLNPALAEKTHFVDHKPVEISATAVRNRVKNGKDISAFVPEEVSNIINQANLYKNR